MHRIDEMNPNTTLHGTPTEPPQPIRRRGAEPPRNPPPPPS